MKLLLILLLLFSLQFDCFSSPIHPRSIQTLTLTEAETLTKKILNQISAVESSCDLSFEQKNLDYMTSILQIPPAPKLLNSPPSQESVQKIVDGLELHQHLLQEVKGKLECSGEITALLADISELMQEVQRFGELSDPQPSSFSLSNLEDNNEYRLKVAVHLILKELRSFTQNILRTLRRIIQSQDKPITEHGKIQKQFQ